jgi:hypothetical protein
VADEEPPADDDSTAEGNDAPEAEQAQAPEEDTASAAEETEPDEPAECPEVSTAP